MVFTTVLFILSPFIAFNVFWKALTIWATKNLTAVHEVRNLAKPRATGKKITGTAVVAGGSIAGLFTARICADHFEQVVIVEPESWTATDEGVTVGEDQVRETGDDKSTRVMVNKRARIPQYLSAHYFHIFTHSVMCTLFPGYEGEVRAEGARISDASFNFCFSGVPVKSPYDFFPRSGVPVTPFVTRRLFETILRRLVKKTCPNLRYVAGSVTGINPSSTDPSRIASVTIRSIDDSSDVVQDASLVVDCSGPTCGGLKWLKNAGYGQPSGAQPSLDNLTIKYDPKMSYVTVEWALTPEIWDELLVLGDLKKSSALYVYAPVASRDHCSYGLTIVEGNKFQMICGGWGDVIRPQNAGELLEFMDNCRPHHPPPAYVRTFMEFLVNKHSHLASFTSLRVPPCTYMQYTKAAIMPSNFVAIGDSVMRLNPIFGQGIAKSIIGASTLDSLLRSTNDEGISAGFARTFFIRHQKKIEPLWSSTKTPDYGWNSTVPVPGESLSNGAYIRWYSNMLGWTSTVDPDVARSIFLVRNFMLPPTDLFAPSVVFKVLKEWWKGNGF